MASIDKIYGTHPQREEFLAWILEHKPKAKVHFYEWLWEDVDQEHPITNFPEKVDRWLWVNCPIQFVRERLMEQYPEFKETTTPLPLAPDIPAPAESTLP